MRNQENLNSTVDSFSIHSPENIEFWLASEKNQFLGKYCNSCKKPHWYPRLICPLCGSSDTYWKELSGKGIIYAFSTLRKAKPAYTVAYIELQEGPKVVTKLIDVDSTELSIGQSVKAVFKKIDSNRTGVFFTLDR